MEYSKIKQIRLINFRSIGDITIDMSDSPIVALVGANEGGKSSVIQGAGAVMANLWRSKQNQYIRTGTDGFAGLVELEDGTQVVRKKSSSVNGYTLKTVDGFRRDATKIDVEVPDYIVGVMGLYCDVETKECLQVRTCKNPLLFVDTTDGQNYKLMHNAINNLDVREASIAAKGDVAKLVADVTRKNTEIDVYKKQLAELPLLDTDYLKIVLSALDRATNISELYDKAVAEDAKVRSLATIGNLAELQNCNLIDVTLFSLYENGMRYYIELQNYQELAVDSCKEVDVSVLQLFEKALQCQRDLQEYNEVSVESCELVDVQAMQLYQKALNYMKLSEVLTVGNCANLHEVNSKANLLFVQGLNLQQGLQKYNLGTNLDILAQINLDILKMFEQAENHLAMYKETEAELTNLEHGIEVVTAAIQQSGIRVVTCDKCGHSIAVAF